MKNFAVSLFAVVSMACLAPSAEAQWVRRYYQPMWVAPQPVVVAPAPVVAPQTVIVQRPVVVQPAPVVVGPQPVTVFRPPVVYQPVPVMTVRNRPILGGTVVRTQPGYRRVVW